MKILFHFSLIVLLFYLTNTIEIKISSAELKNQDHVNYFLKLNEIY